MTDAERVHILRELLELGAGIISDYSIFLRDQKLLSRVDFFKKQMNQLFTPENINPSEEGDRLMYPLTTSKN